MVSYRGSSAVFSQPGQSYRLAMTNINNNDQERETNFNFLVNKNTELNSDVNNSFLNTLRRTHSCKQPPSNYNNNYYDEDYNDLTHDELTESFKRDKYITRLNSDRYETNEEKVTVL